MPSDEAVAEQEATRAQRIAELEEALEKIMECSGDPETYQIAKAVLRKNKS
jgi:hypothetical protein